MKEQVLVIPQKELVIHHNHDGLGYNWIHPDLAQASIMMDRDKAEQDPNYKQVIPYVIVAKGNDVLYYSRPVTCGEKRLRGKYSIGFGGHINDPSEDAEHAAQRELCEELGVPIWNLTPVAVLNDDSTEVGRVHVGLVYIAHTPIPLTSFIPSREVISPQYSNLDHLTLILHFFEEWSQICLRYLPKLLAKAAK